MKTKSLASSLIGILGMGLAWGAPADLGDAATIFNRKCVSCHTVGQGVRVGPDLKGVTQRRDRDWLIPFIQSSQTVIESGDPYAVDLFQKFKGQVMPDHGFTADQIQGLLELIDKGGPQAPRQNRLASTASDEEIRLGEDLFLGRVRLASRGASCSSCHRVTKDGKGIGGTLAPDLTRAHSKFKDKVLDGMLRKLCIPREPERGFQEHLTDEESFALKAFLFQADSQSGDRTLSLMEASLGWDLWGIPQIGLAALALLAGRVGRVVRRKRETV